MEAIVKISGKQYRLSEGQQVTVDRLPAAVGEELTFGDVLMLTDGTTATIGTPNVDGAAVTAKVLAATRGAKILVFKYKPKKRYRRTQGFRAEHSLLEVLSINMAGTPNKAGAADSKTPAGPVASAAPAASASGPGGKAKARPAKKATADPASTDPADSA